MERVERAVIRECFREVRRTLGYMSLEDAAQALVDQALVDKDKSINFEEAEKYVKGQYVSAVILDRMCRVALNILVDNHDKILHRYHNRNDVKTIEYLRSLFSKYYVNKFRRRNIDVMVNNWLTSPKNERFSSGIYQLYRRYKPTAFEILRRTPRVMNPQEHAIVCELLYVDADAMECLLVSGHINIYHGFIHITNEDILYGIMHKPNSDNTGYQQRVFIHELDVTLPMYSAIMIKTGDTMGKPISAEVIYVSVKREDHEELYTAINELTKTKWQQQSVPRNSIIMDYISLAPDLPAGHEDWNRVRYVKDFPALAEMATPDGAITLFREPSRTLSADTIKGVAMEHQLGVFRHSTFSVHQKRP